MREFNYIAVEGNIGAGKTSLAKLLATRYGAELLLEQFDERPLLQRFYADPAGVALPLELSFLTARYSQLAGHFGNPGAGPAVADYAMVKCLVFAAVNLAGEEAVLFNRCYELLSASLPRPDLLVYLHDSTEGLMQNIRRRGRAYEQDLKTDYLLKIQEAYEGYINYNSDWTRVIRLDMAGLDFVNRKADFESVLDHLEAI